MQQYPPEAAHWKKIQSGAISILAPASWKFHGRQGIDSEVGSFTGDGFSLDYDFGLYSNNLAEETEPDYAVVQKTVGGFAARIVSPKIPGCGLTGIYFAKVVGQNRFVLAGANLTAQQQDLALKIFETIRFGRRPEERITPGRHPADDGP